MKALVVLLGGIAGAIVGWVAAAAATMLLGGCFGLDEFEGEKSMTAIFGMGPMGGVAGLIAGLWLALRWHKT
jgi:ABC-type antimicrobial peptide transport system permease subunit